MIDYVELSLADKYVLISYICINPLYSVPITIIYNSSVQNIQNVLYRNREHKVSRHINVYVINIV